MYIESMSLTRSRRVQAELDKEGRLLWPPVSQMLPSLSLEIQMVPSPPLKIQYKCYQMIQRTMDCTKVNVMKITIKDTIMLNKRKGCISPVASKGTKEGQRE